MLKALDTVGNYSNNCYHKNILGNEQWRAVGSIYILRKQQFLVNQNTGLLQKVSSDFNSARLHNL